MSPALSPCDISVRAFLLGDEGREVLREMFRCGANPTCDALARLPAAVRGATADRLADAAGELLDVDLGQVAVAGWQRHQDLLEAARDTLRRPGLKVRVPLAEHTVSSTWRPRVEVVVSATPVASLEFEVTASLDIGALEAGVAAGRLVRLSCGRCEAHVTFAVGGRTLAQRRAPFDLALHCSLGEGVALLPASVPQQSAPTVPTAPPDAGTTGAQTRRGRAPG